MKKRLALFIPNNGNVGDTIHSAGTEYILEKTFSKRDYKWHYFHQRNYYHYDINRSDFDFIIIAGSPYLFRHFWDKYKYGIEIRSFLKRNKKAKKIALGIGSIFQIDKKISDVLAEPEYRKNLNEFYSQFDLIIVRDEFAENIFSRCGIKTHLLPCPSVFIWEKYRKPKLKKKLPLIIFGNPDNISRTLISAEMKEQLYKLQKELASKIPYFTSAVCQWEDISMLLSWGNEWYARKIRHHIKIDNRLHLFRLLARAKYVVSARLHVAIPASLLGLKTFLISYDTRKYTAKFFNIKLLNQIEDFQDYNERNVNIQKCQGQYLKLLRTII